MKFFKGDKVKSRNGGLTGTVLRADDDSVWLVNLMGPNLPNALQMPTYLSSGFVLVHRSLWSQVVNFVFPPKGYAMGHS